MESNSKRVLKFHANDFLTSADIQTIAQKVTSDSTVKVLNYCLDHYSTTKLGFLGSHWILKIIIQKKNVNDQEIFEFFVKTMPINCNAQFEMVEDLNAFEKESSFFQTVKPQFITDNKIGEWSPVCYLSKSDVLVFEDLRMKNYKIFTTENSLFDNFEMLKSTIATVAQFHSCTIITEARLSQKEKRPVTLLEYYPNTFRESMFNRNYKIWTWIDNVVKMISNITDYFGQNGYEMSSIFNRVTDFVEPSPCHRNVVCHGDLWMNNIMFNDITSPPKCLLVDFQVVRYAPLASDLAQLFYINASKGFRIKYEKELIRYYHLVLEETVRNNTSSNNIKIPTFEETMDAYEESRLFGSIVACLYFPIILMNPEDLANNTETSEKFFNLMSNDRTDFVLAYMEDHEIFKTKFREIIFEILEITKKIKK